MSQHSQIETRLYELAAHLKREGDVLAKVNIIYSFRELDKIAYRLGILDKSESYTMRISWWPMIAVLGTFSAGKSTFINNYLGNPLQRTGNQAVDDKFTVICFAEGDDAKLLPGVALDADPRFPFYQISQNIGDIAKHDGQRVDAYLQLKTCASERLHRKIIIDSPGFDADSQRTATLRITKHIIDLSDLVLVFFDARHPEPGAMHDTLTHLVSDTIDRADSSKFMYILNQVDVTARDNNLEEVVAAWQRSLGQAGLTAGRFYNIYNPSVAVPIDDDKVKSNLEAKVEADITEITARMEQVPEERAYRVIAIMEQTAKDIETKFVPRIQQLVSRWKRRTFMWDLIWLLVFGIAGIMAMAALKLSLPPLPKKPDDLALLGGGILLALAFLHLQVSGAVRRGMLRRLQYEPTDAQTRDSLIRAFRKNTGFMRALFMLLVRKPVGWGRGTRKRLHAVIEDGKRYMRKLNDTYTNPSGKGKAAGQKAAGHDGEAQG